MPFASLDASQPSKLTRMIQAALAALTGQLGQSQIENRPLRFSAQTYRKAQKGMGSQMAAIARVLARRMPASEAASEVLKQLALAC
jgi:hypothetical protein